MTEPTTPTALAKARRRDVNHRQQRVHQALADMTADGSEITISAVAAQARLHRSFIHRHSDLHAAVLDAASRALTAPSPASTAISHRSVLAENANLRAQNHRQAQHIRDLEDRLSDLIGQQAFERGGLGAPTNAAALQAEIDKQRQTVLDLTRALEERDEELAAARETNRRLMAELNRIPGATSPLAGTILTGVNTLSTRTLGHLITAAGNSYLSKSDLRDLLMQSGLYEAAELDPTELIDHGTSGPNRQETLRTPLLAAHEQARTGNREAHDALLEIVRLGAERVARRGYAESTLSALHESLLSDGYELRVGDPDLHGNRECRLLPIDPDAVPVGTEITALEAELDQRGYTEALVHYRSAVDNFTDQDHPASNRQLRNMVESLVKHLAADHTGYTDNGRSGQGGAAINTLYTPGGRPPAVVGQPLPENDGGRMLHGIWNILHSNGPHPGLSNADEARIRMQLCTALARFLLRHFPARP